MIYSDWHTSLSFSAHQTLLARDFTDNGNKALSFSIDNVIAIGNEAIKMAIKVLILLPSSRIWPFVVPIFLHAPRQVLWDSSLYLFKIKGLSNNKQHWQAALAYVGPFYWTTGKVREQEVSVFFIALSEGHISGDIGAVCVVKTRELHKGKNSNQQSGTSHWPIAWPTVKFSTFFCSAAPFWLILTDWFCFVFCWSVFLLFTSR